MSLNKYQALSLAKEYVLQRNVRAAIDIYREIIEADPTDLTAINTLGDLYASSGLAKDAMAQFSRVADGFPITNERKPAPVRGTADPQR